MRLHSSPMTEPFSSASSWEWTNSFLRFAKQIKRGDSFQQRVILRSGAYHLYGMTEQNTRQIWINTGTKTSAHYSWAVFKLFTRDEHLVGELVWERALTMIHGTKFPLSAKSALSCTIMGFVSLQLANNYLRNTMNKFVQAVWIHTLWTIQTEVTCRSSITEVQPTSAHSCSVTCSKHSQITNRKPAAPINQILPQTNLSQKDSWTSSNWVMSLCAKKKTNDK